MSWPRTLRLCWCRLGAFEEEMWSYVAMATLMTPRARRLFEACFAPHMTWPVLTRSCERLRAPGVLKLSVKQLDECASLKLCDCLRTAAECDICTFGLLDALFSDS